MDQFRLRVPATAANLGPGYDSLALALQLHNTVDVERQASGLSFSMTGEGAGKLPVDETNLMIRAAWHTLELMGAPRPGLRLAAHHQIPPGSGLGSSAAAVVAGVLLADALAGLQLDLARQLAIAAELEGHADNAAAALMGGIVVTRYQAGEVLARRIEPASQNVLVVVPEVDRPTTEMRRVLPGQVSLASATANAAGLALTIEALRRGDHALLAQAARDELHEPHRFPLLPAAAEARQAGLAAGASAVVLAGAGPGLVAFGEEGLQAVEAAMCAAFGQAGIQSRAFRLPIDYEGARLTFPSH